VPREIAVVVEGPTDRAAVERILASRGWTVDSNRLFVVGGKAKLDARIAGYAAAAVHSPWFVLRDGDHDGDDCPARLVRQLIPSPDASGGMCLRVAVRMVEAWLLADTAAVSEYFAVTTSRVPPDPDRLDNPKLALVDLCRRSRLRAVREGMVPPPRGRGSVGPEYTTLVSAFFETRWEPDVAARRSPSLDRALQHLDRLRFAELWS
jgi:hypothetical protein